MSMLACHHKMPQTRQHEQKKLTFSQFGGWKSIIQVLADSVSGEGSLPNL